MFDTRWCRGSERLVTASGDGTARLFDVETAAELGAFAFHRGTVKAVAVRPGSGGDVFASCGRDGALALWDARVVSRARGDAGEPAARPVAAVERAHEDAGLKGKTKTKTKTAKSSVSVSSAAFAHDGQVLLSAGAADGLVKLWDARRLHRKTPVAAMADADPGASAGGLGRTEDLWGDATTPRRPRRGITSLALAPNGSTRVAASYSDSHIAVFDHNAPSAGPACHLRAPGRRSTFKTSFYVKTAFSPCGTHLASGSCDTAVYVWNADRPLASPAALAGHAGEVSAVDWSPAAFGCLASCADDGVARVWAVDRGGSGEVEPRKGRTDDETEDENRRGGSRDENEPERSNLFFGSVGVAPARDASSPAIAPTSHARGCAPRDPTRAASFARLRVTPTPRAPTPRLSLKGRLRTKRDYDTKYFPIFREEARTSRTRVPFRAQNDVRNTYTTFLTRPPPRETPRPTRDKRGVLKRFKTRRPRR